VNVSVAVREAVAAENGASGVNVTVSEQPVLAGKGELQLLSVIEKSPGFAPPIDPVLVKVSGQLPRFVRLIYVGALEFPTCLFPNVTGALDKLTNGASPLPASPTVNTIGPLPPVML